MIVRAGQKRLEFKRIDIGEQFLGFGFAFGERSGIVLVGGQLVERGGVIVPPDQIGVAGNPGFCEGDVFQDTAGILVVVPESVSRRLCFERGYTFLEPVYVKGTSADGSVCLEWCRVFPLPLYSKGWHVQDSAPDQFRDFKRQRAAQDLVRATLPTNSYSPKGLPKIGPARGRTNIFLGKRPGHHGFSLDQLELTSKVTSSLLRLGHYPAIRVQIGHGITYERLGAARRSIAVS